MITTIILIMILGICAGLNIDTIRRGDIVIGAFGLFLCIISTIIGIFSLIK